jgi:hypothetical protein
MPARDDAGSNYGRPGGSQNSGVNNGGVAGGMGGGFGGGGAGRMGGIGSRTGLTTGNTMFGGMAFGRPGGFAMNSSAFGVRPQASVTRGPLNRPANPGLLGTPTPVSVPGVNPASENVLAVEEVPPYTPNVFNQNYLGGLANFRGMINNRYGWNDQPVTPGPGPAATPTPRAWSGQQDVYWNGGASGGMTPKNSYNGYNPPSYRGSGPSPYDKAYSPGPGAPSNQTRPGANPRGWGGWASPFR